MADFKVLPPKHPTSKLDYLFDWAQKTNNRGLSDWLEEGETIASYVVTVPDGITKVSDALVDSDTAVVVWISGGTNLVDYKVSCTIITNQNGREDTRSIIVPVRLR